MEMHERIKKVRTDNKLTQSEFAKHLGVTRSVISNIELNRLAKPEQKNSLIKLISKEFNINEQWLLDGIGQMFIEPDTFSLDEYLKQKKATDLEKNIVESVVKSYFEVSEEFRDEFINNLINRFKETLNNEDCACEYDDITSNNEKSIEERVAEAEREYLITVHGKTPEQLDTRDKILNFKPNSKSDKEHA
ncbi:helix-turn-helix domain-containing protein [Clostridium ihumii]|uniref:helix-turn-helix domain-containing protein n=1 Tax=Clostridium ihumii TaxID=1470356 RepID=UPI000685A27D|nr:helix-turn-helix transcriptional regulator [Clostridium ihumii]